MELAHELVGHLYAGERDRFTLVSVVSVVEAIREVELES